MDPLLSLDNFPESGTLIDISPSQRIFNILQNACNYPSLLFSLSTGRSIGVSFHMCNESQPPVMATDSLVIDMLPPEILWEIFDSQPQFLELQHFYWRKELSFLHEDKSSYTLREMEKQVTSMCQSFFDGHCNRFQWPVDCQGYTHFTHDHIQANMIYRRTKHIWLAEISFVEL